MGLFALLGGIVWVALARSESVSDEFPPEFLPIQAFALVFSGLVLTLVAVWRIHGGEVVASGWRRPKAGTLVSGGKRPLRNGASRLRVRAPADGTAPPG